MFYLSPLQGSRSLHPLTPGCAALARGYSLAAPSGQSRTRFTTEANQVAGCNFEYQELRKARNLSVFFDYLVVLIKDRN
jgi:hypothetical protein